MKIQDGKPGKHPRASGIGLLESRTVTQDGKEVAIFVAADGTEYPGDIPVVLVARLPTPVDVLNSESNPVSGDLFVDQKVGDYEVKSGL